MDQRPKKIEKLSPAALEKFRRQFMAWGTVCIGSGGALQQYPVEVLEKCFLDAAVNAALETCTVELRSFMQQNPAELAKQCFPILIRAAFTSLPECNYDWLRHLLERPGVADELEGRLEKAFSAKQKITPLAPQVKTSEQFRQIAAALRAGRNIQALLKDATGLRQTAIAKKTGFEETMVSRIVHGGKRVRRANIELFLGYLARLLRP